jgi:hypothetical protein
VSTNSSAAVQKHLPNGVSDRLIRRYSFGLFDQYSGIAAVAHAVGSGRSMLERVE